MGILDRRKKNVEANRDWVRSRVNYWKKEYAGLSEEELKETLGILNRKAFIESWESPFRWNFWFGGLLGRRKADLETEAQRIAVKELLTEKTS